MTCVAQLVIWKDLGGALRSWPARVSWRSGSCVLFVNGETANWEIWGVAVHKTTRPSSEASAALCVATGMLFSPG